MRFKLFQSLALAALLIVATIVGLTAQEDDLAELDSAEARGGRKRAALADRSTSIDLTKDGKLLVNVNQEANSVSIFRVEGGFGENALTKEAELPVGREPFSVAIHPRGIEAYVTNSASGTVSVIDLKGGDKKVINTIQVGDEPRGCAVTPQGTYLFVANYSSGTVSVINTNSHQVINTVQVGGNPYAIAVTNDGNRKEDDETVFVTQFFAELIPGGPGEGFDNGKQGVIHSFPAVGLAPISKIVLSPLVDSGFTANRTNLCTNLNANAVNDTFCPDPDAVTPTPAITNDPQSAFPNQLASALIRGNRLYIPTIGAQPEPPVAFNTNVQGLVHVVDTVGLAQRADLTVNLNNQIKTEPPAVDPTSLDRLFANDIVAIDATADGTQFFIVSRGGNYIIKATTTGETPLNIGAPNNVVRIQTGNIPTGIVVDKDGARAYVNNEVGMSVTVIDLQGNTVIAQDIASSTAPEPGTHAHAVLMGKLAFFTALGIPDNGIKGLPIRSIEPRLFRSKQSNDAWSTCASCHPSGLADGVTWIFADGPRQSIPMDALYSKINPSHDSRINNWSAARSSIVDFNNNSRNVQCGTGFAGGATNAAIGCPPAGSGTPNPNIFDHGISQGASEALDSWTTYASTIRPLNTPQPANPVPGRTLFANNCASCHGGAKWTKSQVIYLNNPVLDRAFAAGGTPRDPGLTITANQIVSYSDPKVDQDTLFFLENVGTFNAANPIEIRQNGAAPLGLDGFNIPSLLGVRNHAPYFHNGVAQNLDQVFTLHALGGGTIETTLSPAEREQLKEFLNSIDGRTDTFRSETDDFKDPLP